MKSIKLVFPVLLLFAGIHLSALDYSSFNNLKAALKAGWKAQGGADLEIESNSQGENCLKASGNGKKAYGGLRFYHDFDLREARAGDYISLRIKQNVSSSLYVSIRNNHGNFYRTFKLPYKKWDLIKIPLDIKQWKAAQKVSISAWGKIQNISIYSPAFSKKGQYIQLSNLKIIIKGKELKEIDKGIQGDPSTLSAKDFPSVKILKTSNAIWGINLDNGSVGGVWRKKDEVRIVKYCKNVYHVQSKSGNYSATESKDKVIKKTYKDGVLELFCKNKALPQLIINKKYWVDGKRLRRELKFKNLSGRKLFITPNTEIVFTSEFRNGSYYFGGGFLGPLLASSELKIREKVTRFLNATKAMVLSNRASKGSFATYRNKLNSKFVFPWWQGRVTGYTEENNALYYTPQGWEMSLGTMDLKPHNGSFSVEDVFMFFPGNWFDFLNKVYVSDKLVAKELQTITPSPEWLSKVKLCIMYSNMQDIKRFLKMTDTGDIMVLITMHFANWSDYRVSKGLNGFFGGKITGPELKAIIDKLHKLSPRVKVGIYQWVTSVSYDAPLFKEHPEWFKKTDRHGNESYLFPNYWANYTCMINRPEVKHAILKQFREVKDYLGVDYIYLDETKTLNQINWESMELLRDDHWYDLWKQMRKLAAEYVDLPLFFNGRGNIYGDINFVEAWHQLDPKLWREFCGMGLGTKTFQKHHKGAQLNLLYWTKKVDYINRILALGYMPTVYHVVLNQMPFIQAAYEIGNREVIDAEYSPDWKKDSKTKIESYVVRKNQGDEVIFSFINRNPHKKQIPISIDLASINIKMGSPVYIWEYSIDNIEAPRQALTQKENMDIYQKYRWRENLITAPRLLYSGPAKEKFNAILHIAEGNMSQIVVSQTCAGVYSNNDKLKNYFFNKIEDIRITGKTLPLKVESKLDNVEIILFSSNAQEIDSITVNGKKVVPKKIFFRGNTFPLVNIGKGSFNINAEASSKKSNEKIVFKPILEKTYIRIKCASKLPQSSLFAVIRDNKTLYTGTAPIYIPNQRLGGKCKIKAIGYKESEAPVIIPIGKGTKANKIDICKRHPTKTKVVKLNKEIGSVLLMAAATEEGKWNNLEDIQPKVSPFVVKADPENLILSAGTSRKITDFRGSAFSGFKFKGLKKIKLNLKNTFAQGDSTKRVRNRHLHPFRRSKREFAGIIVDYHTVDGFSKRVAFSVGIKNTQCNTPNPSYGKGTKPDQFVNLGNMVDAGPEKTFSLNLAKFAPANWDGMLWLSIGTDWICPDRRLTGRILAINEKTGDKEIAVIDSAKIYAEFKKPKVLEIPFVHDLKWQQSFDSKAWEKARLLDNFFLLGGTGIPRLKTSVKLAYDKKNLFLAFRCIETARKSPLCVSGPVWNNDEIEIYIVSPEREKVHIIVDAGGKQLIMVDSVKRTDISVKVKNKSISKKHWDLMLCIPRNIVTEKTDGSWKFNICRHRPVGNGMPTELSTWAPVMNKFNEPKNFGTLIFSVAK